MGAINLSLIISVAIVAILLLVGVECGARQTRAAARDVYPGSPQHREALAAVDEQALDRAADLVPPLPDVDRRDTR